MTTLSTHHALSVPRGTRIVLPDAHQGAPLAGRRIDRVIYVDGGECALDLDDGARVVVPAALRLTVDNDTPERAARLAFAHAVLSL